MRAEQKTAAGWTPAAASETVVLGGVDISEDTPNLASIQRRWIADRFNLAPQRAHLVANLALGGAA